MGQRGEEHLDADDKVLEPVCGASMEPTPPGPTQRTKSKNWVNGQLDLSDQCGSAGRLVGRLVGLLVGC